MKKMVGFVRMSEEIDEYTHSLLVMSYAYRVPACTYYAFDLDPTQESPTVPVQIWNGCGYDTVFSEVPLFSECMFSPRRPRHREYISEERCNWLETHTIFVTNPGPGKVMVSQLLMKSPLYSYAIPTFYVSSYEELCVRSKLLPNAIIKPSGGRIGLGVCFVHQQGETLFLEDNSGKITKLTPEAWIQYRKMLSAKSLGKPIMQPRLDFSLDDKHAVDFRLLVARSRSGNWETVAIYPRIGAKHVVSNVSQGGYIGDTQEILDMLCVEKAKELYDTLVQIANQLPPLLQSSQEKPISCLGIDVGIDRKSMHPYVLEANVMPGAKYHAWQLAEKKAQYYKYLISQK